MAAALRSILGLFHSMYYERERAQDWELIPLRVLYTYTQHAMCALRRAYVPMLFVEREECIQLAVWTEYVLVWACHSLQEAWGDNERARE